MREVARRILVWAARIWLVGLGLSVITVLTIGLWKTLGAVIFFVLGIIILTWGAAYFLENYDY